MRKRTVDKLLDQQNLGRRFGASKMHLSPRLASAAVCSKVVVLLLLIYCFFVLSIVCGGSVLVFVLVCILYVLSSFAIILTRKGELVALLLLTFVCLVTVNVLWLFQAVRWVCQ